MKTTTTLSTMFLAAAIAGLAVTPAAASDLGVTFEILVTSSFPTYLTQAPGDPSRIYYSTRAGVIRVIHNGTLLNDPFLDVTDLVGPTFASFTFHPDFQNKTGST